MPNGIDHVRPGDVISSDLFNQILDRLAVLEAAMGPGGGGPSPGAIVIDHFESAAGVTISQVAVGGVLAIVGSGFPFPPTGQSVSIGNSQFVPLNAFRPTSTSGRLEFEVPDLGGLPEGGSNLFVRVHRGTVVAQRLFRFLPAQGPPLPEITSVHPPGQPAGTPVAMGTTLVVEGSNFAGDPTDNEIQLTPLGIPGAETYPLPGDQLELDIGASGPNVLRFIVPDMQEITTIAGVVPVRLRVFAPGVADPAVAEPRVFRS
ncbi:MAG: hypothetical protein MPN21_11795 [Thermoanaerobaculia bacterium]|nr:hypothetical protein [Thermoanaerobaculia bacterium]